MMKTTEANVNTEAHEVVKFPKVKAKNRSKVSPKVSSTFRRQTRHNTYTGVFMTGVALILTGLSLSHLAHGIEIVTHSPAWESWAMAIGVDLGFIVVEVAKIVVDEKTGREIRAYANATIIGTMIGSAILNAFAFGNAAEGFMTIPAVTLGLAIPGMLYSLTKIIAKLLGAR